MLCYPEKKFIVDLAEKNLKVVYVVALGCLLGGEIFIADEGRYAASFIYGYNHDEKETFHDMGGGVSYYTNYLKEDDELSKLVTTELVPWEEVKEELKRQKKEMEECGKSLPYSA